jgi:hypothetical protein
MLCLRNGNLLAGTDTQQLITMTNTTARSLSFALALVALTALCLPPATAAQGVSASMVTSVTGVAVNVLDTRTTGATFSPGALPVWSVQTDKAEWRITQSPFPDLRPGLHITPMLTIFWDVIPGPHPSTISFPFSADSQPDNFTVTITGTGPSLDGSQITTCGQQRCNVPLTITVTATCTSPSPQRRPSKFFSEIPPDLSTLCPDIKLSTTGPVIVGQTATFTLHIDPPAKKKK